MAKGAGVGNFKSLRFPDYLGSDEAPAYINFKPKQIEFGEYDNTKLPSYLDSKAKKTKSGFIDNISNKINNAIDNAIDSAVDSATDKATSYISGKLNLEKFGIKFGKKSDVKWTQSSINLFLPENLFAAMGLNYNAMTVTDTAKKIGDIVDQARKTDSISLGDAVSNGVDTIGAVGIDLVRAAMATDIMRAGTSVVGGVVANNMTFQIFGGVQHRQFEYQWRLVAKNSEESKEIMNICNTFLKYSLPTRTENSQGAKDALGDYASAFHFYEIPAIWEINYMLKEERLNYHQQPMDCFLSSVRVDYPDSHRLYSNGAPSEVNLILTFVEAEPLYRKSDASPESTSPDPEAAVSQDQAATLGKIAWQPDQAGNRTIGPN